MTTKMLAAVAAAVAVAAPGAAAASTNGHANPQPARRSAVRSLVREPSVNWAGYVHNASGTTQASARWRVPAIGATEPGSASTWVGIDGDTNGYLAQVGTGQLVRSGRTTSYAWWEVLTPTSDLPMQPLSLTVRPGDLVQGQVRVRSGRVTLTLSNLTTRRSASRSVAYRGPGTSAEWIQEDVDVDGRISPAPRWSPVVFSGVTHNGARATLRRARALDIVDARGTRETSTSTPTRTGDGFTVTRVAAGHWSPSS